MLIHPCCRRRVSILYETNKSHGQVQPPQTPPVQLPKLASLVWLHGGACCWPWFLHEPTRSCALTSVPVLTPAFKSCCAFDYFTHTFKSTFLWQGPSKAVSTANRVRDQRSHRAGFNHNKCGWRSPTMVERRRDYTSNTWTIAAQTTA